MSSQPVNPLNQSVPIVNPNGTPTWEFMRKWEQQFQTNGTIPVAADPTAEVSGDVVNGTATTFMRSDAAPKLSNTGVTPGAYGDAAHYPIITVDAQGRITVVALEAITSAVGANPTATASDVAVNGVATTFMRSDAAPAVQKCSSSVFGLAKVDGSTITATGGVITAVASGGGYSKGTPPALVQFASSNSGGNSATFGVAPTQNNLLVAMCFNPTSGSAGAGWTIINSNSTGTDFGVILTKTAGAGESTTQSPMSGVGGTGAIAIWELSSSAHTTPSIAAALTQPNQSNQTTQAPQIPNAVDCLGLSAFAGQSSTFTDKTNLGTQDVFSNTGTRPLAAGHTDLSVTPVAGITGYNSSIMNSKAGTVLVRN